METPADENDALRESIIAGIVNQPSKTYPSMMLVKPGEPQNSFLMLKLDGCQSCLDVSNCADAETGDCCNVQWGALPGQTTCGDRMPRGMEQLSATERDVLRRWILQGARNN